MSACPTARSSTATRRTRARKTTSENVGAANDEFRTVYGPRCLRPARLVILLPGTHPNRRLGADRIPRIHNPGVRLVGVVVRALSEARVGRLVVQHGQI